MREAVYQSLGEMASGVSGFWACDAAVGPWVDAMVGGLEYTPGANIRLLMRHTLLPVLCSCPPKHRYG